MQFTKIFTSLLTLFFCVLANSQKSDKFSQPNFEFQRGLDLYNKEIYEAAFDAFSRVSKEVTSDKNLAESCDYYLALTAIKSEKNNGEALLFEFAENYPSSNYTNNAYLEAGNYYYNHRKPAKSLKWFQKVSPEHLNTKEEDTYNFKMGYAYFSNKKYTEAKQYFLPLTRSKYYTPEANYYYGYISYLQGDYSTAIQYFDKLEGNKRYEKDILYYRMNIEFQNKNFEKVVIIGEELLKVSTKKEVSEISKIVGESYFYLEQYDQAIVHLNNYKGRKNRLSHEDHYFLGYSYYKIKDYENAILRFNRISKGKDEVAQNAYYHLGACYLELNKKPEALNAFKNSSELNFNEEIKEDAAYNYAKLSYEIGNPYKSSAVVLQEYVENYTTSLNSREINKLIIDTYISSRDFEGALGYYTKRDLTKDKLYYEISMYRGMQLFQYSKYQDALLFLKRASSQVIASDIQAKSMFWRAETAYRLNDYKAALNDFQRFQRLRAAKKTDEYNSIHYALGYTYFKLKDYKRAKKSFTSYIKNKQSDAVKLNDSYVRLGDCNFISKSYWEAIEAYNKVIANNTIDADYAEFQKALSYGFVRKNDRKIETLADFDVTYPKSTYKDDALYELGNAQIKAKENNAAIASFDKLIDNYKNSLYIPKAILKQGLIYFNQNNTDKSIEKYKSVVAKYPNAKEAQEAVQNARQVYVDIDKVDEYADWIRKINYTKFSDIDLDNAMFEAAEKKYVNNELLASTHSFKKYLINFPEGLHALKANFYSAQAYFSLENTEKALPKYLYVVSQNSSEYTEPSLVRLIQIYLDKEAWTDAIPYLERLEVEANFPQNILFAQSNLMKAMFTQEKYTETIAYAEKVLENNKADVQIKSDATIFIARSAIKLNDLPKAEKAYSEVTKDAKGALKAEALYYDAYFKNKAGSYDASNEIIQELASKYANHKYWGIKGLIVMAENNIGLKDTFQASYILENVIKNAGQYEDLMLEAQEILDQIQSLEKLKNNSEKKTSDKKDTEVQTEF
ncbi:tetratricopeptide repeat protein [Flavicella marina]|uniref:tetratricopeptide repeat protein n=1 Tax=Flavicella marina TaxID=1475951 RepID=UPI0012643FA3|nr:tetratricopeptide repeat protein [Flavicella marina]